VFVRVREFRVLISAHRRVCCAGSDFASGRSRAAAAEENEAQFRNAVASQQHATLFILYNRNQLFIL
jgi:hypothetical protein